ncbi:Ribosomal lysine N-methyltransferase 3 [Smittium culicis]|uniref:Ribosomal lysine N-methyltransferase 3 n=1 Tax=Smittium culicis TaxID=133412 RepID=A0A1R1XQ26_9FUNG|nr:Ribosomal lysine N-methyltransferase 3 [Smittium culicis]
MGPISLNQSRKILLEWFKDNKIGYDPKRIEIKTSDSYLDNDDEFNQSIGFSVLARTNIPEDETIAQISKKAIISPKKGPLSNLLDPLNISGELALVVTVMYELSLLEAGPFWGYLQSLPYSSDIPLLWPQPDQQYFIGSQVHEFLVSDYKKLLLQHEFLKNHLFSKYPNYFHTSKTDSQPLTPKLPKRSFHEMDASSSTITSQPSYNKNSSPAIDFFSFHEFVRVYSLITSRAFEVDAYLGICLVPFADLFNHKSAIEDVHVVSDTEVCLACGELVGCEHTSPHPDQDEISNDDTNSISDEFSDYSGDDNSSDSSSAENIDEYGSEDELLTNGSGSDSDYISDDDQNSDKSDYDDVLAGEELPLLVSIDPSNSNKSNKKKSSISNKKSRNNTPNNKHDEDDDFTDSDDDDESHFIEITTIKPINKSNEIFNTYGMHSNAYFLNRYGFYDPHNDQYDTSSIQLTQIYQKSDKPLNVPEKFLVNHAKFSHPILKAFASLLSEISNCQPELDSCEFDLFCDRMKLALSQPNFNAPQNVDFDIDSCSFTPSAVSPEQNASAFKSTPLVDLEAFGLNNADHSLNLNSPICSPDNNYGVDFYFYANGYPNFAFLAILSILSMNSDEIEPIVHTPLNEKIKNTFVGNLTKLSIFWSAWADYMATRSTTNTKQLAGNAYTYANNILMLLNSQCSDKASLISKTKLKKSDLKKYVFMANKYSALLSFSPTANRPQTRDITSPKKTDLSSDQYSFLQRNVFDSVLSAVYVAAQSKLARLQNSELNSSLKPCKDEAHRLDRWNMALKARRSEKLLIQKAIKIFKTA